MKKWYDKKKHITKNCEYITRVIVTWKENSMLKKSNNGTINKKRNVFYKPDHVLLHKSFESFRII